VRKLVLAAVLILGSPGMAAEDRGTQLDGWAGTWTISDSGGAVIGRSTIEAQQPGMVLFEQRVIGEEPPQPLWFVLPERVGWKQLFGSTDGVREFESYSPAGTWPIVMGNRVTLRDGRPVEFRMQISRASDNEFRRILEMSSDWGDTWQPVFDYTYRRAGG